MQRTTALAAVLASLLLAVVAVAILLTGPAGSKPVPPNPVDQAFWFKVQDRLKVASERSLENIDKHFKPLEDFFTQARSRTGEFAEEALGWESKWRLIADKVPFTRGDRNATYIKENFERIVFNPAEFEKAIEDAIRGYLQEIESIENRLLVELRQELDGLPQDSALASASGKFTDESFKKATNDASLAARNSAGVEVTKDVAALIATEVLAAVGSRMVVSGGILAAGASASWATLGASVIIGLILDQIISYVWDWWADPRGNLASKVSGQLGEMKSLIIEGDNKGDKPVIGLRQRLKQYAIERGKVRDAAIQSLIFGT